MKKESVFKKTKEIFIFSIVAFMLLIFSIASFYGVLSTKLLYLKMDSEITADNIEIIKSDALYYPVYHYKVNDIEYTCEGNYATLSISFISEDKTVYYNSNDPSQCTMDYNSKFNFFDIVFIILAIISFAIVCFFLKEAIKFFKKNKSGKSLKKIDKKSNSNLLKNKKNSLIVNISRSLLIVLVGFLFAFVGFCIYFSHISMRNGLDSKIKPSNVEFEVMMEDGQKMYSPTYYYEVNGVEYKCESSMYSSKKTSIEDKFVWFDSENPYICITDSSINDSIYFLIIFGGLGSITMLVGIVDVYKNINKTLKVKKSR